VYTKKFVGTARVQSMWARRRRVYETVRCPFVCPSICLSQHGLTAANPLLQVCCCWPGKHEISIDCGGSGNECGQCHVVSVRSSWKQTGFMRLSTYTTSEAAGNSLKCLDVSRIYTKLPWNLVQAFRNHDSSPDFDHTSFAEREQQTLYACRGNVHRESKTTIYHTLVHTFIKMLIDLKILSLTDSLVNLQ